MTVSQTILAAIDLGPSSARVLYHAAAFARLWSANLRVLHVSGSPAPDESEQVADFCTQQGHYAVDPDQFETVIRSGTVSDEIYREAAKGDTRLVVVGSRGHGRVASLLLGSTSIAVLGNAPAPVLLVPPTDFEIVNLDDRASLNCGRVVAAVDLAETCAPQLALASELAHMAGQPLMLMTVAPRRLSDHDAAQKLRELGHGLSPARPHGMIVRRGNVAQAIADCAVEEQSGLVVMGLRRHGKPGVIASAVLGTLRAFVLAVPCG